MLYDLVLALIGDLPSEFTFIYGIACLLLLILVIFTILIPFILIIQIFKR